MIGQHISENFEWGSAYQDEATGFVGILTGYCMFAHTEDEVQLESETGSRWFTVTRIHPAS